ncbi:MAG: AAA family ATPase [Myxococcales bacterium]|nr:AAA family ATPase [Myxococcales bacterium]
MPALNERLQAVARDLESKFLGRSEVVRCMLVSALAGEHLVLIGPPGTAKSALVRTFSKLCDARYFEYLLTRFTEPNELFGPVDIAAFREGTYRRRTAGMLPEGEIVFLDEVFKSNSAILNSLLTLLNERRYVSGGVTLECPLLTAIGASNEVPADADLAAIFDRFLLRVRTDYLDAFHFQDLLQRGWELEAKLTTQKTAPLLSADELRAAQRAIAQRTQFTDTFLSAYRSLVLQIRAEGIGLSDRRVVKLLKLCAASAFLDGRTAPDASDLFVLQHVWNAEDQAAILQGLVQPVLEAHYREHPETRRLGAAAVGLPAIEAEIERVRVVLAGTGALSDVQLFAQLRLLGELKTALSSQPEAKARELAQRVDVLLDAAFKGGRFGAL